jgi:hypothetical protein
MSTRALGWTAIALLIVVALGGAYLIVAHNNPALNATAGAAPVGVFH